VNITSVASNPIHIPAPAQPKVEQEIKAPALQPEPELSAREKFAKAFYTKKEEPWNGQTYYPKDSWKGPDAGTPMTRELWVEEQYDLSAKALTAHFEVFREFMQNLDFIDPDLARKNFGYTLGYDGNVKVLDPKGNLTENEMERLTDEMNRFKTAIGKVSFKETVQNHAKIMMGIVDHDKESFGGKQSLSLLNIQDVVDYSKIVMREKYPNKDWVKQIIDNAEKRDRSLVDVRA